jgi:hypothetical protein
VKKPILSILELRKRPSKKTKTCQCGHGKTTHGQYIAGHCRMNIPQVKTYFGVKYNAGTKLCECPGFLPMP